MSAQNTKYRILATSAYTLIEILVVITIIGLLFGVGYANFRGFSQRQQVINAAKSIQGDLRIAQENSLAGQKPIDTTCDSNTLDGYSFKVVSNSEYKVEASCGVTTATTKDVYLPSDVTISTPSPNPILFKVLGNGTNIGSGQSAVIEISQTGTTNKTSVTISSGGQIQ